VFSVKEWVRYFGEKYSIKSVAYVGQMCTGQLHGPNKQYKATLPESWKAAQVGRSWLIYHKTYQTREKLLRIMK
jgi:hypothetical protein